MRTDAYALLFAHGASAVCCYDAEDRIIDWNDRYLQFFPEVRPIIRVGLPFVATVRPFLKSQHPHMSSSELDQNIESALLRHRTVDGPYRYQRADNGVWLEVRVFTATDGGRIKIWSDVTASQASESNSDQLVRLMTVANLGLILHDGNGVLRFVNSRFFSEKFLRIITKMPAIETRGRAGAYWAEFHEIFDGDRCYAELLRVEHTGALREPVTLRARTGLHYRIEEQAWDGGVASIWTDVTAQVERKASLSAANKELLLLNARLLEDAQTDVLTGLPNRRRFDVALQELRIQCESEPSAAMPPSAVAIIDLDHFKAVNDSLGHPAGDAVLIEAARRLQSALPTGDLIARLGGEEFGVLFRSATEDQARERAFALLTGLSTAPFVIEGKTLRVTASIGVAPFYPGEVSPAALRRADLALFEAKASGRNCVV